MAFHHSSPDMTAMYRELQREQAAPDRDPQPWLQYKIQPSDIPLAVTTLAVLGVLCQLRFDWIGHVQRLLSL